MPHRQHSHLSDTASTFSSASSSGGGSGSDTSEHHNHHHKQRAGLAPWAVVKDMHTHLPEEVADLTQKQLKIVCDMFMQTVLQKVKEGDSVCFRGNMTLKRVLRKERTHKNLMTGEDLVKPAHYTVALELKPALKQALVKIPVDE